MTSKIDISNIDLQLRVREPDGAGRCTSSGDLGLDAGARLHGAEGAET